MPTEPTRQIAEKLQDITIALQKATSHFHGKEYPKALKCMDTVVKDSQAVKRLMQAHKRERKAVTKTFRSKLKKTVTAKKRKTTKKRTRK